MTTREWLGQNGYEDVVELIDEVMAALAARGSRERRNWWDVLAGGRNGKPSVVAGREFPVLRVAQARQGRPITANAICRSDGEQPPEVVRTGRWSEKPRGRERVTTKTEGEAGAGGGATKRLRVGATGRPARGQRRRSGTR